MLIIIRMNLSYFLQVVGIIILKVNIFRPQDKHFVHYNIIFVKMCIQRLEYPCIKSILDRIKNGSIKF